MSKLIPAKNNAVIYVENTEKNYVVNGNLVFDFYDNFNDEVWFNR